MVKHAVQNALRATNWQIAQVVYLDSYSKQSVFQSRVNYPIHRTTANREIVLLYLKQAKYASQHATTASKQSM
jgi:hypothetical protein